MAFRVLTDEEREQLTPDQRDIYDSNYAMYLKRVRFIEALDRMARARLAQINVELKPVPKTLKPDKVRFKPFEMQKPEINKVFVPETGSGMYVPPMPEKPESYKVTVPQVGKHEFTAPEMVIPKISKVVPDAGEVKFEKPEMVIPEISKVVPDAGEVKFEKPEMVIPKISKVVPAVGEVKFEKPEIKVSVEADKIVPKIADIKIPAILSAGGTHKTAADAEESALAAAEKTVPQLAEAVFEKPEMPEIVGVKVAVPDINVDKELSAAKDLIKMLG